MENSQLNTSPIFLSCGNMNKVKSIIPGFWVHNLSKIDIHLHDLNITIPSGKFVNLEKNFTPEQLEKSLNEGYLGKRKDVLKITFNLHIYEKEPVYEEYKGPTYRPMRVAKIKQNEEELFTDSDFFISDEKFVDDIIKDLD